MIECDAFPINHMSSKVFYFPWQKPALAAAPLPEEVYFLNPGLELPPEEAQTRQIWTPHDFPYDARGAARCLQDLLAEGELLGSRLLSEAGNGGPQNVLAASTAPPLGTAEGQALSAFARTGGYLPTSGNGEGGEEDAAALSVLAREQAHKFLLLSFHLEDSILSVRKLAQSISENEASLRNLLMGAEDEDNLDVVHGFTVNSAQLAEDLLDGGFSRWEEILRAWLLFLPHEPIFFYTDDFSKLPDLNVAAQALPLADAQRLFPASLAKGWRFTEVRPEAFGGAARIISGTSPQS